VIYDKYILIRSKAHVVLNRW